MAAVCMIIKGTPAQISSQLRNLTTEQFESWKKQATAMKRG